MDVRIICLYRYMSKMNHFISGVYNIWDYKAVLVKYYLSHDKKIALIHSQKK